jgi:4-diphosphocytidyl-2-C-methyl-D-erythritol kinase
LPQQDIAYAKINLALHVRRKRADGYHELESCFAFLDCGDTLTISPAEDYALTSDGEFGGSMGDDADNLVTRALRLGHGGELPNLHCYVTKCLPVAAGLGGGSADAAAALRLIGASDRLDLAAQLGADVPACVESVPVIGRGTGTALSPGENDVKGLACLLVNPRLPLSTGPVFQAWDGIDRGPMPEGSARAIALAGRNDLEEPAIRLCPAIAEILAELRQTAPLVARMSGSGATCFALYEDLEEAKAVSLNPAWWTMIGRLR